MSRLGGGVMVGLINSGQSIWCVLNAIWFRAEIVITRTCSPFEGVATKIRINAPAERR